MSNKSVQVQIELEGSYSGVNKYNLLTSYNGYQWSGGGLMTIEDLAVIRDEINKFLNEDKLDNE